MAWRKSSPELIARFAAALHATSRGRLCPKRTAPAAGIGVASDHLARPDCVGRLRLLATIADPRVIARILTHLGLPVEPPRPAPSRQAAGLAGNSH